MKHLFSHSPSLRLLVVACEIPHNSSESPTFSHRILTHAVFTSFYSTSMRPMRMVTRWFWVKGRMAWCTLGGTWATKYASPSRKSQRRTARMRNQHSHCSFRVIPYWESLSCTVSCKNVFFLFHHTLTGKGFGRDDTGMLWIPSAL